MFGLNFISLQGQELCWGQGKFSLGQEGLGRILLGQILIFKILYIIYSGPIIAQSLCVYIYFMKAELHQINLNSMWDTSYIQECLLSSIHATSYSTNCACMSCKNVSWQYLSAFCWFFICWMNSLKGVLKILF